MMGYGHRFAPMVALLLLSTASTNILGETSGDEFQVNTTTDDDQWEPDVGMDGQGGFVVVFQNHLPVTNANVSAQRFNPLGEQVGEELLVNQTTSSGTTLPAVAVAPDGSFAVVWQDFGDDGSGNGIFLRRYDAQDQPLGDNVVVNTTTDDSQHRADVAMAGDGSLMVVWEDVGPNEVMRRIRGQRYDANGTPAGGEFDISTDTAIDHTYPRVTVDGSGRFIVGWSAGNVGANQDVVFRRFDASGNPLSDVIQVNVGSKMDSASGVHNNMSLASDMAGNFVVTWRADDTDGRTIGILARRYDASGNPLEDAFVVNEDDPTQAPEVAVTPSGQFAIAYEAPDGNLSGVFVHRYNNQGQRLEAAFQNNTETVQRQDRPAVALLESGDGVVVWRSSGDQDGDADGVFARRFVDAAQPSVPTLVSAVLPASRSVQVDTPATVFATVINTHTATAVDCGVTLADSGVGTLSYQTSDAQTNDLIGTPDTPTDIPPDGASVSFLLSVTPTSPMQSEDVAFNFDCNNTLPATVQTGLNTLLLSASVAPVADIIALAATPTADGVVDVPGDAGANAFAVATINVGAADTITATPDTGDADLPLSLFICDTDGAGQCITPPASGVTVDIGENETPTFTVFVNGSGNVPFDASLNRVFVRFTDGGGVTRGATSVAARTVASP